MNRTTLVSIVVLSALCTAAFAGSIHGKVSGVSGESVVYVEAVPGKTFPAPAQHITIDQKGLMFVPRITTVAQGTRLLGTTWGIRETPAASRWICIQRRGGTSALRR